MCDFVSGTYCSIGENKWYPGVNRKSLTKIFFWWEFKGFSFISSFFFSLGGEYFMIEFCLLESSGPKRNWKKNWQIIENEKKSQKLRNEGCRGMSSFRSQHISFHLSVSTVNTFLNFVMMETLFSGKNKYISYIWDFPSYYTDKSIFSSVTLNVTFLWWLFLLQTQTKI